MSESSKMGLFGSKEENSCLNSDQANKDESPERYAPYSVDSDSETYDTEALSIMDINDIIGVQSEPVDSTLESEIAALSKIIDSKTDIVDKNTINTNLNVNTVEATPSINLLTNSGDKQSESSVKNNDSTDFQLDSSDVDTASNTLIINKNTNEFIQHQDTSTNFDIKETGENYKSSNVTDVLSINKSLQLIGDAYTSEDSQETELDEVRVDEEPKVVFSCKPLVDKQNSKTDHEGNLEGIESIDIPVDVPSIVDINIENNEIVEKSSLESIAVVSDNDNKLIDQANNDTNSCKLILDQAKQIVSKATCPEDESPVQAPINVFTESTSSVNVAQSYSQDKEQSLKKDESDLFLSKETKIKPDNEKQLCQADLSVNNVEFSGIDSNVKENSTLVDDKIDDNNQNILTPHLEETSSNITQNLESLITSSVMDEDVANNVSTAYEITNEASSTTNVKEIIDQSTPVTTSEYSSSVTENLNLKDLCEKLSSEDQTSVANNIQMSIVEKNEENILSNENKSKETNEVAEKLENKCETMEIMNIEAFDVKDKIIEESETIIECNKSILLPSCSFENEEETTKDVIEENTLESIDNIFNETEQNKTDLKDNYIKDSSANIKSDVSCEDVKSIENDKNTNIYLDHDNHQLLLEKSEKSDINHVQKPNSLITNTEKDILLSKSNENSEELDANILEPSAQSFTDENNELSTLEVTSKPTEQPNEVNLEVVAADNSEVYQIIQDDPGIHSEKIKEPITDLKLNLDTQEADTETLVVENVENLSETESEVIDFKSITSKSKDLNEKNLLDSLKSENLENPLVGVLDIDLTVNLEESVNSDEVIVHSEVIEESTEKISCELEQNSIVDLLLVSKPETEPINQINNLLSDILETETESSELDCNLESENDRQTKDSENIKIPGNSEHKIYEKETKCIEEEQIININNTTSEIKESLNFSPNEKLETDEVKDQLEDVNSITEVLQTNPEISELESAVKFLRESEEQNELETSLLSKTLDDTANELTPEEEFSSTYIQDQKISQDLPESESEFETPTSESIAISEAEIITEAAKLESERKQLNEESLVTINQDSNLQVNEKSHILITQIQSLNEEVNASVVDINIEVNPSQCLLTRKTTVIPKTSILEERLKEPPKIEIPVVDSATAYDGPITPRSSLLIQKDAKMPNYEQLLESSKVETDKIKDDNKIIDNVRKDSDRHEVENISSPSRIILKIAKSAIASCGEPKSPKSPKIRSTTDSPNLEDSPGHKLEKIKLKLSKSGHPSIIPNELAKETSMQWHTESSSSLSPLGIKRKFSNVQPETKETSKHKIESIADSPKRTESPIAMKIKLSKSGDASIIQSDTQDDELKEMKNKEKIDFSHESKRTESPLGVKIKRLKTSDPSISPCDYEEGINTKIKEKRDTQDNQKRIDSPIPVKMKLSKVGGASIITVDSTSDCKDKLEIPEVPRRTESPLGTKIIKMSKTGDASIIYSEVCNDQSNQGFESSQTCGLFEPSTSKDIDSTNISKKSESSLAVKIKVSKDGEAKIVHSEKQNESQQLVEIHDEHNKTQKSGDSTRIESMKIKVPKSGHPMIVTNDTEVLYNKDSSDVQCTFIQKREQLTNRSEVTIEPITYNRKQEELSEHPLKRKDGTPNSYESKKTKLEAKLSQILPEVTIQPIVPKDQQQQSQADYNESSASLISREQMNVINQEISITQVKLAKPSSDIIGEKLKNMLTQSSNNMSDDCEIIEQDPELIIVNENSNSSQDIMIIDEVAPIRVPDVKIPKKRGRPRRNALPFQRPETVEINQDPLAIDETSYIVGTAEPKENERPKRTCRSQKSYAPPKRGRGRGRGKRKFDRSDIGISKKMRLEQNLSAIENSTTALITLDEESTSSEIQNDSSELYKALRQPLKVSDHLKKANDSNIKEPKESSGIPDHQNWLTPLSKKQIDNNRNDGISMVQVLDEETRMSAESVSRSQTPARNIPNQETTINEESQGSVISTATTESEKVKVKNRRMEINFDPDEGPFTVEKIAEYEWPLDRKGETFMIQEQISQYLGVKSFKRKYPDLKRRMVDMEERNYLRENLLVNEAMCDMGLTAICSSEVLDIMCSDFPDQYEEYRKHMREKQIKEHSKKQKELTAAANAEKNRIDLAEMAVQSALSWNVNFNKARNESRRCSLDLQTFTIHVPTKQPKINDENKISHYPVSLIPGQYTDYYREYTPAELRYYPLNTVLYGPMRPNERKFDSQSEGSQSDSDSDSSSDDSSCSSSEGTQDTEESQSTMDDVDIELSNQKDKSFKCKMCLKHLNKNNKTEVLIQCGTCHGHVHPSCLDLTLDMVPHIHAYAWQCTDCKTCAQCHDPADEDKMLFCDMCDRGYHIYCVGLRRVPQGRWHCQECAICASCGSREAGGMNADRNSVAQWQHEYKKGDKNTRVYVSTLCVPCSKLWRKGRYCPHCSRCHTVSRLDVEENLVHCSACDKYLHLECVENKIIDRKNYQCDVCMQNRQRIIKSSVSKAIRA